MQRLKRSTLYLWLVHHGKKIMDAFPDSTVSPGNNDKGDKNVVPSTSVSSGLNVNNSSDPKEPIPLTYDEVTNERLYPNEVTSATPVEPITEISHQNELSENAYYATTTESSYTKEVSSITYVEPIDNITAQYELASFDKLTNAISDLNELTEVTNGKVTKESTSQYEFIPVPCDGATSEITAAYEFIREPCDEATSEIKAPSKMKTVSLGGFNDEIKAPSEMKTVPSGECDNVSKVLPEMKIVPSGFDNASNAASDMRTTLSSRLHSASNAASNMRTTLSSRLHSASTVPPSVKSFSSGLTNIITVPYEMKSVSWGRPTSTTVSPYEYASVSAGGATSECTARSEMTTGTQEGTSSDKLLAQLSRMDDEFVDFPKSYQNTIKKIMYSIVLSLGFRIFGILLIFVDMSLAITELVVTDIPLELHSISLAIALFFVLDVLLRVYVEGKQQYFSDSLNILDAVIIGITLLADIIYMFYNFKFLRNIPRITVFLRPLRLIILVRIFHLAHQKRQLEKLTRRLVSGNKRRFKKDGFDLDLTYVTERIIAMSFPSSWKQSFYRNPIEEVVRFLDTKHPNHYRVYNLCSEKAYDPKYFHYRVQRIMIDDHNVPTLNEMVVFTKEVREWMAEDEANVVVIHCKGGKGRTGTMICACLIASSNGLSAEESLYYFGERRTDKRRSSKFQGVETPSQNRYVGYFAKVKHFYNWNLPPRQIFRIKRIIIYSIHGVGKGDGSDLKIHIIMHQKTFFCSSSKNSKVLHDIETDRVIIRLFNCPALYDDVKVKFFSSSSLPKYYDNCSFFFWFHTSFIQEKRLYLTRNELDNPHKPKTWKIYRSTFAVQVFFDET